jgi:hypothetical protein
MKMTRKIVSQTNDSVTLYPKLGLPVVKFLENDIEHNGRVYKTSEKDPRYPTVADMEYIHLVTIGDRRYDSVHSDYTEEMLAPTEDNDYKIETELDSNFTYTVLKYNLDIATKYNEDSKYIEHLGLPEYDPELQYTDVNIGVTVSPIVVETTMKYDQLVEQETQTAENKDSAQDS